MRGEKKIPASGQTGRDSIETIFKLNDDPTLAGVSDAVKAAYAFAPEERAIQAQRALYRLAYRGHPFTVDDIRRAGVPEPDIQQRWGSIFAVARNLGFLEPAGFTEHYTPGGAAMPLRVWRGAPCIRKATAA